MVLEDFKVENKYHIGHFFSAGWTMSLTIAINFSIANGTSDDPGFLHSVALPRENAYLKVLQEFGSNFVDISNEETLFQVYGFGAKDPEGCFPLAGADCTDDPNVEGFDDVKELYSQQAGEL